MSVMMLVVILYSRPVYTVTLLFVALTHFNILHTSVLKIRNSGIRYRLRNYWSESSSLGK